MTSDERRAVAFLPFCHPELVEGPLTDFWLAIARAISVQTALSGRGPSTALLRRSAQDDKRRKARFTRHSPLATRHSLFPMRGRPWLQSLLVLLAFAALAVPVWRLTRSSPATATGTDTKQDQPRSVAAAPENELVVRLDFSPPPRDFQLQHLGRTLLEGRGPQTSFSTPWRIALPKEGADLALRATWPTEGQSSAATAARLRVTFPGGRVVDKTYWTPTAADHLSTVPTPPAALVEIFTVPGEPSATPAH